MAPTNSYSGSGSNGILTISASQNTVHSQRQSNVKPPFPRLKVIIRRLPPGLAEAEFRSSLGREWEVGQGKVDWLLYKAGKVSKDPSKPSRPSRAYFHLTNESHLFSLSDIIRDTSFENTQNPTNTQVLIGPPIVEYSPYGSTPINKPRVDPRSGTIDQDPEFMAFLEGLANPTKELSTEIPVEESPKNEKATTTPLIQYLREKKATKSKELTTKSIKKHESQSSRGKNFKEPVPIAEEIRKKGRDVKVDRLVGKAAKDAVRILNREITSKPESTPLNVNIEPESERSAPKSDTSKATPNRQRGVAIAAHIRMLHRDLGLSSAQSYRQARRDATNPQKIEKPVTVERGTSSQKGSPSKAWQATPVPTAPKVNSNNSGSRRGRAKGQPSESGGNDPFAVTIKPPAPVVLLKKSDNHQNHVASNPIGSSSISKPTPAGPSRKNPVILPSEGATQAFVKHANPSQGITESLLKEAMEKFGTTSKVEIDKRKGFAYVNFTEAEGLKNAMAANPISVAQGTVQVMQRKGTGLPPEKKSTNHTAHSSSRSGRAGRGTVSRRGGRGA
ncbi:BgTH12-06110 [Blumeria graminis f. sp. triticale]|uniref:BgTH12-06110 n=1 Tax=Blumeria graminis f. sp. triticale TaxID=1689686 RepID=A0A9W4GHZ0_BLUGR|nr:BgTH12-06110 [Blumeria graminis f. sp. triticale]